MYLQESRYYMATPKQAGYLLLVSLSALVLSFLFLNNGA